MKSRIPTIDGGWDGMGWDGGEEAGVKLVFLNLHFMAKDLGTGQIRGKTTPQSGLASSVGLSPRSKERRVIHLSSAFGPRIMGERKAHLSEGRGKGGLTASNWAIGV